MKIATAIRHYSKGSGVGRYVTELFGRFANEHEVHVFANKWNAMEKGERIILHKVPTIPNHLCEIPSFAFATAMYQKFYGFDIIHTQGCEGLSQDIITAHSCHKAYVKSFKKDNITSWDKVVIKLENYQYRKKRYKKIISVSRRVKKEIIEQFNLPPDDIEVIPCGVNANTFSITINKENLRSTLGIKDCDLLLLEVIGHGYEKRGVPKVIKALTYLPKKTNFLVIGVDNSNPLMKLAARLGVKERVIIEGFINSSELPYYYGCSDLFIYPTEYDAFSLTVLEAMASGLPVVVSEVAGTAEIIEDGKEGFLLQGIGNVEDIVEKINQLLKDEALRKDMGNRAREKATLFSWDKIAEKTLEVYKEVLDEKKI